MRAVRGDSGPPDADSVGALFEGWMAQLLRAYKDYRGLCDRRDLIGRGTSLAIGREEP